MKDSKAPVAILFDLDGTLIDGFDAIGASVNHVRSLHGLTPLTGAEIRRSVGNGLLRLLELTVPAGTLADNSKLFLEHHPSVLREGTRAMPGVLETLSPLAKLGVKLGICSNKPVKVSRQIVDHLGLAETFDVVLGPEDVPQKKPAPDMLLRAIEILEIGRQDTLYVGDMDIDIKTARAAGIAVWAIPTGSHSADHLRAEKPDRLMAQMTDLLELYSI